MAAQVWTGLRARADHLRRLSVVFAVELRLKIVTELYMREMSPKEFHQEFGGGSLSRVSRNFEKLASTGWLRRVKAKGPGGSRRGKREGFFRASELAFFDQETWAMLPYSVRAAFSWNAFKQIAHRLREAMEAETFQARPDRHLTDSRIVLDEEGWQRLIDAISAEFASQFEEQEDARRRVADSGEPLIRASSILMAFELAAGGPNRPLPDLALGSESPPPLAARLSKIFADQVAIKIIDEANKREISAPLFHAEFGEAYGLALAGVRQKFKKLTEIGWLRVVGLRTGGQRRGGSEKFYRATSPVMDSDENGLWEVPKSLKETGGWKTFERLSDDVKEAITAGTFDARPDRVLSWSILALDPPGWQKVIASVGKLLAFALREHDLARERFKRSGQTLIPVAVVLGAFESPPDAVKEP